MVNSRSNSSVGSNISMGLSFGKKYFKSPTRGYRNNNPGNLNYFKGWRGIVGTDGRFGIYKSIEYGIRAMYRTLRTYHNKYHANTVTKIIKRWAPAHENNTQSYIDFVCQKTGYAPHQVLSFTPKIYIPLMSAMCRLESQFVPTLEEFYRGIELEKS